ncbi:MAG: dipeptide epimerase [Saprospiraceae bacterium]
MATIDRITIYTFNIPLVEPFVISRETVVDAPGIVVHIQDSDGGQGFGECTPFQSINGEAQAAQYALAPVLAKQWIGLDPHNIKARMHDLDRCIYGNTNLKSAFDLALYDLNAKYAGLPLYRYLGADMARSLPTDMTIGIDQPEAMARQATEFVAQGFTTIKVKLGKSAKEDTARLDAIRQAVGSDVDLRIDANQGWNREDALTVLRHAGNLDVGHCEEPIARWDLAGQVALTEQSPVPIMADESLFTSTDAQRLIDFKACHQFNLKLGKSGGIHDGIRILQLAEEHQIICQVGCFSETRFALTALAHLVYAHPIVHYYDMDSALMLVDDPIQGGIRYTDQGTVELDDHEPGIGANWDPGYLAKLPQTVIS